MSNLWKILSLAAAALACCTRISAEELAWANARDVVTEKQLETQMSASRSMMDQLATLMRPLKEERPAEGNSLYSKSIILFDGEMFTLIPVGSVLHLPPTLRNRIQPSPRGDFTVWPKFLKRNSTWLAAKEVPLKMARGDANLNQAVLKEIGGSRQLLVAVYRECPISVLEPAPETDAKTAGQP